MSASGGYTTTQTLFFVLWPVIIAAAVVFYLSSRVDTVSEAVGQRAPIAIIDVPALVEAHGTGDNQNDRIRTGLAYVDEMARQLQDAGYLVMDKRSVMASPGYIEVTQ